jgi:hypothetical protein
MGFQQILDRWRAIGRSTDADHATTAFVTLRAFRAKYSQVVENLDTDRAITQAQRCELLEQLLTAVADDGEIVEGRIQAFCWAHQCRGLQQSTAQTACLGHVERRSNLEKTLESAGMGSATSFTTRRRRTAAPTVDHILRCDLAGQHSLLVDISLSKRLIWSFYQSRSPDDPFRGVITSAPELVRRLGLGLTNAGEELLVWGHRLRPGQTAHRPTAFDAADYEFFRPGGKTRPLTGDGGLREVVHRPITGDQLTFRIENARP